MSTLEDYGWDSQLETEFRTVDLPEVVPARVTGDGRGSWRVHHAQGECLAEISGRLRHAARGGSGIPVVGDWVAAHLPTGAQRAIVRAVLPRRTRVVRKAAGRTSTAQVLLANVDLLFVTVSLREPVNPRRLERYLAMAWESGARPVVLLTKADLADGASSTIRVAGLACGVPVHALSAVSGAGLEALGAYLTHGKTAALVGPSGVGKSTLVNALLGQKRLATRDVRESDGRGRHATTSRRLFLLTPESGHAGLIADTPGLRELQLWSGEGAREAFADIEHISSGCRFRDCRHEDEPSCAVREALATGQITPERLQNLRKLEREAAYLERRKSRALESEQRRAFRHVHKDLRRSRKS